MARYSSISFSYTRRPLCRLSAVHHAVCSFVLRFQSVGFDFLDDSYTQQCKGMVTAAIQLPFDCNSTALRPLNHLRYDRAAALSLK